MLLPAPDGRASALCALPDNACDAYRAVGAQLAEHPGAEVLIVGGAAASIALYAVAFARALGSARVRYVDSDEERCAAAAALGAEVEHRQGPWPRRYDRAPITVEASGELDGLTAALRSTDDYGFCTAVAIHFAPTVPLPLLEIDRCGSGATRVLRGRGRGRPRERPGRWSRGRVARRFRGRRSCRRPAALPIPWLRAGPVRWSSAPVLRVRRRGAVGTNSTIHGVSASCAGCSGDRPLTTRATRPPGNRVRSVGARDFVNLPIRWRHADLLL